MKYVITLNHYQEDNCDMMLNISITYGIRYDEKETKTGKVMLFTIREELADTRTAEYFQDVLCFIFNTDVSNYCYSPADTSYEVSIYTILLAFVDSVRNKSDERHYKELLRKFNDNRIVDTKDSLPVLHLLKNNTYTLTPIEYYKIGYDVREMLAPEKIKNTAKQTTVRNKNKRATYRNFNWENLYESCRLYRDFCDGKEFYDTEKIFLLARNICGVAKGKQHFLDVVKTLKSKNILYEIINWKEILTAIIKNDIPLASCEQCEYCQACHHLDNMLSTAKPKNQEVRMLKDEEYYSLEEANADLKNAFYRAVEANDYSVHIIKGQTALGKTDTYLNYMAQGTKPFLIAVPTHKLKNQILEDARNMGITDICCTPDIDEYPISEEIKNSMKHFYHIGAGEFALKYLTGQLLKMNKTNPDYEMISSYLRRCKKTSGFKGHIITTHAKLIHMSKEILDSHVVIVDEDILRTLLKTDVISMEELKKIRNSNIFPDWVISRISGVCMKRKYHRLNKLDIISDEQQLEKLRNMKSNIYGLLRSEYVRVQAEKVDFLIEEPFPECKIIILSATIDHELYKMIYPDRNIEFYECRKARYKGKVIQYTDSSYSRYDFDENQGLIEKLKNQIAVDNNVVITFKDIEKEFNTIYHFGNTEGLNLLKGKNLAVIGLPNLNEIVYCLYAMRAGSELKRSKMYPHRIEYNNRNFYLNSYQDKILQKIQTWILSSQLEQAVGRARLLRENCIVTVYSGFPVEQAELRWKT